MSPLPYTTDRHCTIMGLFIIFLIIELSLVVCNFAYMLFLKTLEYETGTVRSDESWGKVSLTIVHFHRLISLFSKKWGESNWLVKSTCIFTKLSRITFVACLVKIAEILSIKEQCVLLFNRSSKKPKTVSLHACQDNNFLK